MRDRRSMLMIVNPIAGRGRARRRVDTVARLVRAAGIEFEVVFTRGPGDAERIATESIEGGKARLECIVACGGDGTVQEIANALAGARERGQDGVPALGLAPGGRCNDFARVLGISRDAEEIARVLIDGRRTEVDLGRTNGRYFCTVLTAGIDAEISRYVDEAKMPIYGTPAYLLAALIVLSRYRPRELRVEGDFGVLARPVFIASAANTSLYGGAVPIAPQASPVDGLLDWCIIDGMSMPRALALIPSILRGRHTANPKVHTERSRRATITAEVALELWADGQKVAMTPAVVEAVPHAIEVVVPKDRSAAGGGAF